MSDQPTNKPQTKPKKKMPSNKGKKIIKRKPSLRAQAVLKDLSENLGKPISKAMRDAGYKETYCDNPQQFVRTVSVKTQFEDFFPKEFIYGQLRKLHNAHQLRDMTFPKDMPDAQIISMFEEINCRVKRIAEIRGLKYAWYWAADNRAQKDALDMSFKIMGEYTTEKNNPANPLRELSDEELMAEINKAKGTFNKK